MGLAYRQNGRQPVDHKVDTLDTYNPCTQSNAWPIEDEMASRLRYILNTMAKNSTRILWCQWRKSYVQQRWRKPYVQQRWRKEHVNSTSRKRTFYKFI